MSTSQELNKRIESLEIALLLLINGLRNKKDGYVVEVPEIIINSVEKLILKPNKNMTVKNEELPSK